MPLENPKSEFSKWYDEVILRADIVDKRTPVKGANVLLPNGYEIWEKMKYHLNQDLKRTKHKFAYFPLFIPEDYLTRETEHFAGFTPEVAWVTHVGDTKLDKKVALRPTSETIMYDMFAKWLHSHAELPMKYSQWCNIVRWDTSETRPLLRDREFLWNESHTVHATREEAEEQLLESMRIYQSLFDKMAITSLVVKRPGFDTFAGADYSIAYDMPMPDGKVLQIATTHMLGDNFSKAFNVKFLDTDGETKYAYQTSYGLTTRLIAALISVHGDDQGLVIPPEIAPVQLVIVPITFKDDTERVLEASEKLYQELVASGFDVEIDTRDQYTPGWKFSEWEMRGVPIRIEFGPRDLENNMVVLVRRDTGVKTSVNQKELIDTLHQMLHDIQITLKHRSEQLLQDYIRCASSYDEIKNLMTDGKFIIKTGWCESITCADDLKDNFSLQIRGPELGTENLKQNCVVCKTPGLQVYVAAAY